MSIDIDLVSEIETDNSTNNDNSLKLKDSVFCLPLRVKSFNTEKEQIAFIRNVEKLIRSSLEYKLWVSYITSTLGHTKCCLTDEKLSECQLDVHHHPLDLFLIVKMIINDFIEKNTEFTTYDICEQVMELHYQNKVSYMVLLSDLHYKYHNGFQKLPIEYVHGDYKYLLDNFKMEQEERANITDLINTHIKDCKIEWSANNYPGIQNFKEDKI
jgi:hypothetical protein